MARVRIIGHRGAGQGFVDPDGPPENTLPAFEAGWASGANACELDVQLTADGQVLAIHDDTTDRTTGTSWIVADHTAAELQALDAGRWKHDRWAGTRLPLLDEVLAAIPEGRGLFIELKDGPQIVPATVQAIRRSNKSASQLVLISFDIDTIAAAKSALPEINCLLVVSFRNEGARGRWTVHYNEGPEFSAVSAHADAKSLVQLIRKHGLDGIDSSVTMPASLVTAVRRAGLKLGTWTVNELEDALELVECGVSDLTTDRPAAMRAALQRAGVTLA